MSNIIKTTKPVRVRTEQQQLRLERSRKPGKGKYKAARQAKYC